MATKLKDLAPILVRAYIAKTPVYLRGKPAIGKTQTIDAFVEAMKGRIADFRSWLFYAPTMSPMDIQASAPDYDRGTLRLFNNEALPNAYVDPDMKGVIFFGELPNADQTTTKLLQKYINGEDMNGVLRKPDGVMVIADGNRIEDKSSTQQQGRAFLSRFMQLEAYSDATDNIEYAAKHSWHPFVQTFFKENPSLIDNYDEVFETTDAARQRSKEARQSNGADHMSEEGKQGIWANMRSWKRISDLETAADQLKTTVTLGELTGCVGHGVGTAYHTHKAMFSRLASFEEVMAKPDTVAVPTKMDEMFALAMLVAARCADTQLDAVHTFGSRLPLEMQATILRNLSARRNFNLVGTEAYVRWIGDAQLVKMVNGR